MPKTDGRDTRAVKKSVTAEIEIPGGKKSKKQLKKFNIFKKKYTFNICYNYSQHTRRNGSWSSLWRNCK